MLFNSITFLFFFVAVFWVYWFPLKEKLKIQNLFLLISSYIFYGCWEWRFLSLIIFSSIVDYTLGIKIHESTNKIVRKRYLYLSLLVNLGLLGVFKYFNFFAESFTDLFNLIGFRADPITLNLILPVGISFYTFQTLSYTIDIYRKQLEPTRDIIQFFAFVSFFPQLVAGPIERAKQLLPQFNKVRVFDYGKAVDGSRQILWGLFQKTVIADNCAPLATTIFENYETMPGAMLVLGSMMFAFQIYGDFAGYSNIALGVAKLLGFQLMINFRVPYFSRDIAEFWRRWHISLSTWFRDYLYIPLGGSRGNTAFVIRNVFIIFLVSGFWHGANWTFVVWGGLNALYFVPLYLLNLNRNNTGTIAEGRLFPSLQELTGILVTFLLTCFAWIFFRAENLSHAFAYITNIFQNSFISPQVSMLLAYKKLFFFLFILIVFEWFLRDKDHGLQIDSIKFKPLRWGCYYLFILILICFSGNQETFIYFQF